MNEFLLYINTLIKIAEINYGYKTCLSYSDGQWYSREHSGKITPEEACEYILNIITGYESAIEQLEEDLHTESNRK